MAVDLQIGDVVVLKAPGPSMVIVDRREEKKGDERILTFVNCTWFDQASGTFKTNTFPPAALEKK